MDLCWQSDISAFYPRNGEVRVAASLGPPETLLEAYLEARDEGAFSLASTVKLLVEVTDVNDHALR